MSDTVRISARLDRSLVQAIEDAALREERTLTGIIKRAARAYVSDEDDHERRGHPRAAA